MLTPFDPATPNYLLGTYLVGKMGTGKSTALSQMVDYAITSGWGCCVFDPHGDLIDDLLGIIPREREEDVILLDYRDEEHPPGFDIFAVTSLTTPVAKAAYIAKIVDAFRKLWGQSAWGPRIENLLRVLAVTFMENPGATLHDMERIITDPGYRKRCVRNITLSQSAVNFWNDFESMTPAMRRQQTDSTMNKIQAFLLNPVLSSIVGQSGIALDVTSVMRNKEIVLLTLPERVLGEQGVDFLGTLYLSRFRAGMQQRLTMERSDRTPFLLFLDEFHRFAGADIPSFLAEARKAGVGLVMAHQWRGQILEADVRQAPMAAGNLMVFRTTPEDATSLARGFRHLPAARIPKGELYYGSPINHFARQPEQYWGNVAVANARAFMQLVSTSRANRGRIAESFRRENEDEVVAESPRYWLRPGYRDDWREGEHERWWQSFHWQELERFEYRVPKITEECNRFLIDCQAGELELDAIPAWVERFCERWGWEEEPDERRELLEELIGHLAAIADYLIEHPLYQNIALVEASGTEIATALMTLPKFTAHCLFDSGEQTVGVSPPDAPPEAIDVARVREAGRARFCRAVEPPEIDILTMYRDAPPKRFGAD